MIKMAEIPTIATSKMLTIPQLEAMKILPGKAIRRLIAEGQLSCVIVGSRKYVNFTVFEQFLNDGNSKSGAGGE